MWRYEDMNDIIFIILRTVVVVIAILVARYVIPAIKAYIDAHNSNELAEIINNAVYAAQQTITGNAEKKEFVMNQVRSWLLQQGIEIDDIQLDMLIEAAVLTMKSELNNGK